MTVFIVESGDYEQRTVMHVASSIDAAVRAILDGHAAVGSVAEASEPRKYERLNTWCVDVRVTVRQGVPVKYVEATQYDVTEMSVLD